MNITEELLKLDPTLSRHNEGEWGRPFDPNKAGFSSFNDAGVECEVGEFLYAMVRVLKTPHVLETGTHWGIGASYIGQALKANREGHLDTVEFTYEIYQRATKRILDLDLTAQVSIHLNDARSFNPPPDVRYGLIFLDTEPQTRFDELIRYFDFLTPGGFVFIHDLHRHMNQVENKEHGFGWPFGELREAIKNWVKAGSLRPFHFPTPRGLTGFYKPSEDDYKWR